MNGLSLTRNRKVLKILLVIGPILIGAILWMVSSRIYANHREGTKLLKQSYEDREQLNGLRNDLDELQAAEIGFLLTGRQSYLWSHEFSFDDTSARVARLKSLYSDRPLQLEKLKRLVPLIDEKLAEYRTVTSLKSSKQDERAVQLANGDGQTPIIEQIRSIITEMQVADDGVLAERKRASEANLDTSDAVSTGLLFLSGAVVFWAGVMVLRIRQLQSIITICAWTQRVNFNGQWMSMDDFLWRRFRVKVSHGISEQAFEGIMGMVGKNLTVSDSRPEKFIAPQPQPEFDQRP
jgi:CHASE3 domain sensor protein